MAVVVVLSLFVAVEAVLVAVIALFAAVRSGLDAGVVDIRPSLVAGLVPGAMRAVDYRRDGMRGTSFSRWEGAKMAAMPFRFSGFTSIASRI